MSDQGTPVTLIRGDKVGEFTEYKDALSVNMYAVAKEILGAKGYMMNFSGLTKIATGIGIDRGAAYNERQKMQFRVSGESLISVNADKTVTSLGTVPGFTQARVYDNYSFNTQCVVANGKMFLYDPTNGFREVTDTDLGNPIDSVWIDGYYFLTDGEYLYHTDLNDETAIDPLKFATAEFMPDPSNGLLKTQDNKVAVFGRYSLEYFVNDATSNFSFSRVQTRAQKIGIVATHAKCEYNNHFYIVGGRREDPVTVYQISLGASKRIATREIDQILKKYTEPELADIRVEPRMTDGTGFILIHLPYETLCFNTTIAEQLGLSYAWSILKTDIEGSNPYRGINGVFDARFGEWHYGDRRDENIGMVDESVPTHYERNVEWILYTPLLKLDSMSVDEIEIQTIPGLNTADDATVSFSLTKDGLTYGKEHGSLYSDPADYGKRFYKRRLGYVKDFVGFKFRGVSSSKMAFALMSIKYG